MAIWSCWFLLTSFFFFHCCIYAAYKHINSQTNETKPVIEERKAFLSCHISTWWYPFWGCTRKMSNEDSEDSFPRKCRRSQPAKHQGPAGAFLILLAFHNPSVTLTHKALTPPVGHRNTSVIILVFTGRELPLYIRH